MRSSTRGTFSGVALLLMAFGVKWSLQASPARTERQAPAVAAVAAHVALVDEYCLSCHDADDKKGDLDLDAIAALDVAQHPEVWEKVVRKLRARQMPPVGRKRPDAATYDAVVASLETTLDAAARARPNPGRTTTIRRLTRTEYRNAIRDLLALDVDVAALLPPDESSYGFDNVTVGDLSPTLLDRYLSAAEKISRIAVGAASRSPGGETFRMPPDLTQEDHVEGLPPGTRGGAVVDYTFPRDGEYEFQIRLTRDRDELVEGLSEPHEIELLLDRERVKLFTVVPPQRSGAGTASGAGVPKSVPNGDGAPPTSHAAVDQHLKVRIPVSAGPHAVGVTFLKKPSLLLETPRQPYQAHFNSYRHPRVQPAIYAISIVGPYAKETNGTNDTNDTNGANGANHASGAGITNGVTAASSAAAVTAAPGDSPSRKRIFVTRPRPRAASRSRSNAAAGANAKASASADEERAARKILSTLMRRAYRRPVTAADLDGPLTLYRQARANADFDAGIEMALSAVLVSPQFLFRVEHDPAGLPANTPYRISDVELASRLSFFLWSSLPDDELLDLAAANTLHTPAVLERQVRRMLADERSHALVDNFAAQWLHLRNLDAITPDMRLYPDFDDNLRQAFRQETSLFFDSILREDRSLLDLLRARYTFVNERLAKHYGIPHIYGSRFRRIELDENSWRGGLLRHGSILTVTSYATRTSPVVRGKWVLDTLIGTPPPPPLPDVPALKDVTVDGSLIGRARLAEHRKNPQCAACHNLIDPIGLSLEKYDAIGRRRASEAGVAIDASGGFADGSKFEDVRGLEDALLRRPELFVGAFAEKLMTYATGRGVEYYDAPAIRAIVRDARANEFRMSSIVLGVVKSPPFQMRTSR
jgi:mono/diheme cytochrome c family protein